MWFAEIKIHLKSKLEEVKPWNQLKIVDEVAETDMYANGKNIATNATP